MDLLTGWDWLVLLTALISTAIGFWRGAIRTLFGLGAWIVGIVASPFVVPALAGIIDIGTVPVWVLFIAAFLLVFIALRLVGGLLLRGIRTIGLGGVDRAFGGALGVARAALIVMVAALVGYRLGLAQEPAWKAAQSRPLLEWMVARVDPLLPVAARPAGQGAGRGGTFLPDGGSALVQEPSAFISAVSAQAARTAVGRLQPSGA